ncbi:hypothetical protein XENOCAPTIV_023987 [Xenoophorus captivus]|uniref:Uncharacterized protein n=1 Tax=Xenoophorus captivus TaxID=1517983 RepID=A0ABV0SGV3_9TELE
MPPVTVGQEQEEIAGQQTHIEDDRHPDSKTLELAFSQQGALYGAVAVQHVMMTGSRKQRTNSVLKYGRKKLVCLLSGSASWQVVMLRDHAVGRSAVTTAVAAWQQASPTAPLQSYTESSAGCAKSLHHMGEPKPHICPEPQGLGTRPSCKCFHKTLP